VDVASDIGRGVREKRLDAGLLPDRIDLVLRFAEKHVACRGAVTQLNRYGDGHTCGILQRLLCARLASSAISVRPVPLEWDTAMKGQLGPRRSESRMGQRILLRPPGCQRGA
jgi:hypothetical protein